MQQYSSPRPATKSKSPSRALAGTLFLFMFLGFVAGFGLLLYRNWYLFS
jgi:hypothetical protein